jgi:hypothetical protein
MSVQEEDLAPVSAGRSRRHSGRGSTAAAATRARRPAGALTAARTTKTKTARKSAAGSRATGVTRTTPGVARTKSTRKTPARARPGPATGGVLSGRRAGTARRARGERRLALS